MQELRITIASAATEPRGPAAEQRDEPDGPAGHAPCWLIGTTTARKAPGKVRARPARRLSRAFYGLVNAVMKEEPQFDDSVVRTWIEYHLWLKAQDSKRLGDGDPEVGAEADANGWWAYETVAYSVHHNPEEAWPIILRLVELAPDEVLGQIAAGPLEDLLACHPYQVVDRVEAQARTDRRFRRCLSGVWGWYSIPEDVQERIRAT